MEAFLQVLEEATELQTKRDRLPHWYLLALVVVVVVAQRRSDLDLHKNLAETQVADLHRVNLANHTVNLAGSVCYADSVLWAQAALHLHLAQAHLGSDNLARDLDPYF